MKRLSDDPAVRLAECRGFTLSAEETQHKMAEPAFDEAAAPVPPPGVICDEVAPIAEQAWRSLDSQPTGEVEVVAEVVNKYGDPEAFAERDLLRRTEIDKIKIGTELVDRAHVTRLTSELESYRQGFWGRMAARNQIALRKAESELTKVRELLTFLYNNCEKLPNGKSREIKDFLAHQSAPAAKGDPLCSDGGKCGIGGFCGDCEQVKP